MCTQHGHINCMYSNVVALMFKWVRIIVTLTVNIVQQTVQTAARDTRRGLFKGF